MKRLLMIALAFCLLMGNTALAQDTEDGLIVFQSIYEGGSAPRLYQKNHPDRAIQVLEPTLKDEGYIDYTELLMGGEWDVAFFYVTDYDLEKVAEAVLLLDLSTQAETCRNLDLMYPKVQDAITVDGQRLAFPAKLNAAVTPLQVVRTTFDKENNEVDLRAQLGITDADLPTSFSELATFAENYMTLPRETRAGSCFMTEVPNLAGSIGKHYFTSILVELYTREYHDGTSPLNFDTPVFREGLADVERMLKAFKSDTKKTFAKDGSLCFVLGGSTGALFSEDVLNIHLTGTDEVNAELGVVVINANTKRLEEALELLTLYRNSHMTQFGAAIYDQLSYDERLDVSLACDLQEAELYGFDQESLDSIHKQIETRNNPAMTSLEDAQWYRENIAPYLNFTVVPKGDPYNIIAKYAAGGLSMDKLITKLNEFYAEGMQ